MSRGTILSCENQNKKSGSLERAGNLISSRYSHIAFFLPKPQIKICLMLYGYGNKFYPKKLQLSLHGKFKTEFPNQFLAEFLVEFSHLLNQNHAIS
jgi:hypothetical protein